MTEELRLQADANNGLLTFPPEEWAPGVWAGAEGAPILVNGKFYMVTAVDFETKQVRVRGNVTGRVEVYLVMTIMDGRSDV